MNSINKPINKPTNKRVYNWSFKPVPQKDQNGNLWPFVCIRDVGKNAQECRSMSKLKESFVGTSFNQKDCPKVLSRYSAITQILKEKYLHDVSKITHLFITFTDFYFLVDGDNTIKGGNYGSLLCPTSDISKLLSGFFITNNISDTLISNSFNRFKESKSEQYAKSLQLEVKKYIDFRKQMIMLDNTKTISDIFSSYDLEFSSLRYLIVSPLPQVGALDYKNCVGMELESMGVYTPKVQSELAKIPSLEDEINSYIHFSLNANTILKSIKRVFLLDNLKDIPSRDFVKNLFVECMNRNNKLGELFCAPLSPDELKELKTQIDSNKQLIIEDESKLSILKDNFSVELERIIDIISRVSTLSEKGNHYTSVTNMAEKSAWVDYFIYSRLQTKIQEEYDYKRSLTDSDSKNYGDISSLTAFLDLGSDLGLNVNPDLLSVFMSIIPSYFIDGRKTVKSLNLGLDTFEKADRTVKILRNLRTQMYKYLEVFIGVEYGILGMYMKRFSLKGVTLNINLMSTIRNKPFVYSKNVLDIAERYMYKCLGASLNSTDSNFYQTDIGKEHIGVYLGFCKKYIDLVNGYDTPPLTHSGESNEKLAWVDNLLLQLSHLEFVYAQYNVFFQGK